MYKVFTDFPVPAFITFSSLLQGVNLGLSCRTAYLDLLCSRLKITHEYILHMMYIIVKCLIAYEKRTWGLNE